MGLKITQTKGEEAGLDLYLTEIEKYGEEKQEEMLKKTGEETKRLIINQLIIGNIARQKNRKRIALSDDVKLSIRSNKDGRKVARIQGGKSTGTLWHIVNDGTYRSKARHFIDKALSELDKEMDKIWGDFK